MIKNKTKIKTKFIATLVAIFMLISNISVAIIGLKAAGERLFAYQSSVSISNSNFNSPSISSGTTLPVTPSSWTKKNTTDDVTAGIITLDTEIATDEKIEKNYKLENLIPEYTGMADKQVLMLNAVNNTAAAGYASSTISMSKASFYVVEFMAYTQSDAHASAKITGNDSVKDKILTINTNASWRKYRIYVATSNMEALSANLELWLGVEGKSKSAGAVFFDNIAMKQYDNSTFVTALNAELGDYLLIDLNNRYVPNFMKNADFETQIADDNWKVMQNSMVGANKTVNGLVNLTTFNANDTKVTDEIKNTNIYGNKNALLINNLESGFVGYESGYFTIAKNGLYRLSFLVKSNITAGSASAKLVERNPYTNELLSDGTTNPNYYPSSTYEAKSFTISSLSSSGETSEITNGWKTYSFFVKANVFIDTELSIQIMLGSESEGATGYILFDHFTLEKITSNEWTANVADGTEANLDQYATETSIKNGAFNLIKIESADETYPYAPESWTLTTKKSNGTVLNGVINTSVDGTALSIPTITPINNKYTNNNVLMIGNISSNNQKYKSSSVSLAANSYAKITVDVLTYDLATAKAGIRLVAGDDVLAEIANISTDGTWQTYTLLVKTGYEAKDIAIELNLGENGEGTGYAFFDNVIYSTELDAEKFDADTTSKKADLSVYNFTNIPADSTETQGVYAPYDFTASNAGKVNEGAVTSGVIDTSKYGTSEGYNESSFANPGHPEGESSKVLMIKSTEDVYYLYGANVASKIEKDNYYKIVVKVKTQNVQQDLENKKYKDSSNKNEYPFGASINIDGIDAQFTGIDTNGEWKTYTIYINCTTDSDIKLQLSLGSENALTKGAAYFSAASIEKIEESDYTSGIKQLEDDASIDNVLAIGNTDVKKDEDSEEQSNGVNFDWMLIPSLVFGIAIIFAVVMVIVRQTKRKSHKKAKIQKEYSKENMKKLADNHKLALDSIKKRKAELVRKQNRVAEKLNEEKMKTNDIAAENIEKYKAEYDELGKKIAAIEEERRKENSNYKLTVDGLKDMKIADEKRNK